MSSTLSFPAPTAGGLDQDRAEVALNRHMRRALAKRRPGVAVPSRDWAQFQAGRPGFPPARRAGGAPAAPGPATAARRSRSGPGLSIAPVSFTEISAQLQFGPPTDISAGWDGTLWAIDASGAPQRYDPMTDTWSPQDTGIDAVVAFGEPGALGQVIYHFRGDSYVMFQGGTNQVEEPLTPIAETWRYLPYSFTQGVDGAANVNGELYLFRGGLYVVVRGSGPSAVSKLTGLAGWPQAPAWKDGVIDAVSSDAGGHSSIVQLYRGTEVLSVDMAKRQVLGPPAPLSSIEPWRGHVPPSWVASGIDAAYYYTTPGGSTVALYRGTAMVFFQSADKAAAVPQYLPNVFHPWPASWNPVLAHAPSGRAGALSAAASDGTVVWHDGTAWAALPALPGNGQALSVSAGRDGAVYAATTAALHRLDGGTWAPAAAPGGQIAQVAVGDAGRVWVRGASNAVSRLNADGSGFTPATLLGPATHLSANADGTVWRCNDDANAYRFISEGTEPPEPIPLGNGATGVRKVASTGFGNSFCLAGPPGAQPAQGGTQLFAYQSNYQFKTSQSYNTLGFGAISEGAGLEFILTEADVDGEPGCRIVGLDAQTGDLRFQWPDLPADPGDLTNPVYDPQYQSLYIGQNLGLLTAVDIRAQRDTWTYVVPNAVAATKITAAPALAGSALCFGDSNGMLYQIDTRQADSVIGTGPPTPVWTHAGPTGTAATQVATPLIQNGEAVFVTWATDSASSTRIVITRLSLTDGTENSPAVTVQVNAGASGFVPCPPVAGTIQASPGVTVPAIFVNAADRIIAIYAIQSGVATVPGVWATKTYAADVRRGENHFTSGLAFDNSNGVLWAGDSFGNLTGLGPALAPVANTPIQPRTECPIMTTPLLYTDSADRTSVLFGTVGAASTELWVFDPARPPGAANPVSVATGQTRVAQLSASVRNGVVYAAGATFWDPARNAAAGQVFAINIDRATQALRDFIVESQLMQDFDEPPAGSTAPPAFARYQTHLTVVDDLKAPRPFEAVKVWADRATVVSINGAAPVSIGPGDGDFAAAQTGADGAVTIVSGSVTADGSDETDLFAAPLRVWAGFMDPYERVVVYPDREFHGRLAAARALTDPNDPGYDDPDTVNLQTAQNYVGTTLFTDAERSSGQPQNVASAIQTMTRSVALSGGGPASATAAGKPGNGPPGPPPLGAPPGKYLAYPSLPGGAFSPVNVAATRPAVVAAPAGLQFASNDDGSQAPAFSVIGHADATTAIDALDGQDWTQSGLVGAPLLGSIFASFWNFIKKAAATITHIVVSIGKEIYAGIRLIVNGVAYVFRRALQTLEDVVAAIGAFFVKLAKKIKEVVEVIGILFNFEEILKTHIILRNELLWRINGNQRDPQNYPGYVNLIKTNVIHQVDQWFLQKESDIRTALEDIKALLAGQRISTLDGAGSTPATLFTVAPVDNSKPAFSHSVACMWALRKTQAGQQQVSFPGGSTAAATPSLPQGLQDFINTFIGRLTGDGNLHADLENAKSDLKGLFSATSFTQFAELELDTLIDLLALLLDAVLAVANAFVDGVLNAFADFLTYLFDPATGLLNQKIKIPVLGTLYSHYFGEDLTVLNLVMLVAAIPVTIVYRALAGRYPSQDLQTAPGLLRGVNREAIRNALGIIGGVATVVLGVFRSAADVSVAMDIGPVTKFTAAACLCAGIIVAGANEPQVLSLSPTSDNWILWGMGLAPMATALIAFVVGGQALGQVSSAVLCLCSFAVLIDGLYVFFEKTARTTIDKLRFSATFLRVAPGAANPLKYDEDVGLLVPVLDFFCSLGSAGAAFAATVLAWDKPVG